MERNFNIFIIDDHPTMIEGYKSILYNNVESNLSINSVYNCKDAYTIIMNSKEEYDIILLDLNLPPYEPAKIHSGEDLAKIIRKKWPNTKIMVLTSHTESFLLYNFIKKINPEGLLVKSDFTPLEFLNAYRKIFQGETYYTTTARQSLKNIYIENNFLDSYNRRIVTLLSKGIKTKNLPEYLHISISAIDKRKATIKDFFNISKGNDEDIIREAKKRGFI